MFSLLPLSWLSVGRLIGTSEYEACLLVIRKSRTLELLSYLVVLNSLIREKRWTPAMTTIIIQDASQSVNSGGALKGRSQNGSRELID
ncbi:hypothetical protein BO86DRAFT_18510 [Aspergillus japonicus CBS 114.51]|uniref:Uncharacterized protein n=1 Tax=Aspergillus japonicus CBS 114.51 TaxID=1448312 RepID=A0A8T8WKI9_ASPJA|nr:hypothetical protein BO86DRAFT_18510 [Aspergillus japonicus CBS 114.51]RAH76381.1 hypothetical protein BO86DRAFT_18510 [Aspergillus japonicus CBS 114.51]